MNNYQLLITKLDRFIRKYYLNKVLRGGIYFLGLILTLFLIFSLLEHYFYFSTTIRRIMFYGFILSSIIALLWWVVKPLLSYFKLGKVISHEQAAVIIGTHFSTVEDKLLNILQLKRLSGRSTQQAELVTASIDQKASAINPVSFRSAIDLTQNRRYLPLVLPSLLILVCLMIAAPTIIQNPANRIINNDLYFEKPAPFFFKIENKELRMAQYDDFKLKVSTSGKEKPSEVYLHIDGYPYKMNEEGDGTFYYIFKNVERDRDFYLASGPVRSGDQHLKVIPLPVLEALTVEADYPAYTGYRDETIESSGDLTVPEGTHLRWFVDADNTSSLSWIMNGEAVKPAAMDKNSFTIKKQILRPLTYKIKLFSKPLNRTDSVTYRIQVVPDKRPLIGVTEIVDSADLSVKYFEGEAEDDYGLRRIEFIYAIREGEELIKEKKILINGRPGTKAQYSWLWSPDTLKLEPGQRVTYYFQTMDNDAVNGSKISRTRVGEYRIPTESEMDEIAESNKEAIKKDLEDFLKESKELREEIKALREKMLNEKEVDWQKKKDLEKLLEKQKNLKEKMERAREKYRENRKQEEKYKEEPTEEQKQKEAKLEELIEKSEEQKALEEKIRELMDELQKNEILEMSEQMEQQQKSEEMRMEQLLELYKQLEVEKEIKDISDKLEKMAEEQEKLSEETEDAEPGSMPEEKQEELNKEFDKLQEKVEKLQEKNKELEAPKQIGDTKEQSEEIQEEMQESLQEMQDQQQQNAAKKQKNAAEKMKKMSEKMQQNLQASNQQQNMEDMQILRQLLENLIGLSFEQEDLISEFSSTRSETPRYVELVQNQFKIKNNFSIVRDSLEALSKRVFQLQTFITEEINDIDYQLEKTIDRLEERETTQASESQRRLMTDFNDLALMLDESMQQMQQQMASKMTGNQMCNKPKPGEDGKSGKQMIDKITKQQGELNKRMQQKGKGGQGESAEEFAKMAAEQAAIRRMLEKLKEKQGEQGKNSQILQEIQEQMNQTEVDLVNKKLDRQTLMRQQDILTRLLESEKAFREQDKDEQRISRSAEDIKKELPPAIEEYLKQREGQIRQYQSGTLRLSPFYKQLVEEHYENTTR